MRSLLFVVFVFGSVSTFAGEGQELHDESCLNCHIAQHDATFYTRENLKITNYAGLKRQTSLCASNFSVGWFPEEELSVVDYLNQQYYKLPKTP